MNRREFIGGLGGATWSVAAWAQRGERVRRIGSRSMKTIPGRRLDRSTIYSWLAQYRRGGWGALKAKPLFGRRVGRTSITSFDDFKEKVRSSVLPLQRSPAKIRAFFQKPSLQYAA